MADGKKGRWCNIGKGKLQCPFDTTNKSLRGERRPALKMESKLYKKRIEDMINSTTLTKRNVEVPNHQIETHVRYDNSDKGKTEMRRELK